MDKQILRQANDNVKANDLDGLKKLVEYLPEYISREYMFKQVFLTSCIHSQSEIIEWMVGIYHTMDPVAQIGLRHTLTYGKYLIKNPGVREWYTKLL